LLVCAQRLKRGALAFVTSATLLDAFLYTPLRRHLLQTLQLRDVVDLGPGVFDDTQVRTCVTVWTAGGDNAPRGASYRSRRLPVASAQTASVLRLNEPLPIEPTAPEWLLRPPNRAAQALDDEWCATGERLTDLVPVSFPGLKTRFDELLVDDDPERLLKRIDAFLNLPTDAFLDAFPLPERCGSKLRLLPRDGIKLDRSKVRPFYRYAGAKHRGAIPESARAYCYLDRRLIPRGDHRLQGTWDPHVGEVKLVFNIRELPLSAAVLTREGCVHDHRHARFAPLEVPEAVWGKGAAVARSRAALGPNVPNLSLKGRAFAEKVGGPRAAFAEIAKFINSREVQEVWAPAFGTLRILPVPVNQQWGQAPFRSRL
ncbi:MAG: SAM-dependent DNA methyltransferase, partial [Myxococcaceae bacterium]